MEVLELGAGFHGLPSLVAACCGARHVLCSEMDPVALHQLDINTKERESENCVSRGKQHQQEHQDDLHNREVITALSLQHFQAVGLPLQRKQLRTLALAVCTGQRCGGDEAGLECPHRFAQVPG